MEFSELVNKRYSCKKYSDRTIEKKVLESILNGGRAAPTARNLQEFHVYVIQSEEGLKKIDSLTPCRYGATTVLMVTFDSSNTFTYPGGKRDSGVEDATIVATHLMLAASNEGVDNCWINNFDPEKAESLFALPENEKVLMFLDLGYKADGFEPLPNHTKRKELVETVSYI